MMDSPNENYYATREEESAFRFEVAHISQAKRTNQLPECFKQFVG